MYKLPLGPPEKKAVDGALKTIVNACMPPLGEVRSRANDGHSSGTNPDHGLDNCIHEVVGSALGRAIYNVISTCRV